MSPKPKGLSIRSGCVLFEEISEITNRRAPRISMSSSTVTRGFGFILRVTLHQRPVGTCFRSGRNSRSPNLPARWLPFLVPVQNSPGSEFVDLVFDSYLKVSVSVRSKLAHFGNLSVRNLLVVRVSPIFFRVGDLRVTFRKVFNFSSALGDIWRWPVAPGCPLKLPPLR
jgi:hypothetical protein